MDKKTLEYMRERVDEGGILTKRIEHLEKIKSFILKHENANMAVDFQFGSDRLDLSGNLNNGYAYGHYRKFILDGIDEELKELQRRFDEL